MDRKVLSVTENPMKIRSTITDSVGIRAISTPVRPVVQMIRHKNPLTSENPALASSSFQPGCPKYTVVGKGFPNSAPVMVETPSMIMERRSG